MKKKSVIFIIVLGIIVSGVILMYSSFALFTQDQISKSAITIKVGTMMPTVKVDGAIGTTLTVPANSSKTFTVTLENLNSEQGKFLFYYLGSLPTGVKFGYLEESGKNTPPGTSGITLAKNGKQTYSLYLANTSSSNVTINLGSLGGLSTQPLSLPSDGHIIEKTSKSNSNILNVYKYDQVSGSSTFCVTGEESTCQAIDPPGTYTSGTIIKYKVNDTTTKYFHVVSDNGDTLTLQQRENILISTACCSSATSGPDVVLNALVNATSSWTNILSQTYEFGYKDSKTSTYTKTGTKTANVRMITLEEAQSLGCSETEKSCPLWLYNYLTDSTKYGGTVNSSSSTDWGYWTMFIWKVYNSPYGEGIYRTGLHGQGGGWSAGNTGARAVIMIQK